MAEYRFRPIRGVPGGPGQNRTTVVDRSERQLGRGHLNQMLDFSFGGPLSRHRLLPIGGAPQTPPLSGSSPPTPPLGLVPPPQNPRKGRGSRGAATPRRSYTVFNSESFGMSTPQARPTSCNGFGTQRLPWQIGTMHELTILYPAGPAGCALYIIIAQGPA